MSLQAIASIEAEDVEKLKKVVAGPSVGPDDLDRWFSQGFCFGENPSFGLTQSHGGPCGVISVVQAEVIRDMLFDEAGSGPDVQTLPAVTQKECDKHLEKSTWRILRRASNDGPVCLMDPGTKDAIKRFEDCEGSKIIQCDDEDSYQIAWQQLKHVYSSNAGCFLYLLSLVESHSINAVKEDADDSGFLIGQFGHCTQELMNLLLVGKATSNVFDGDVPLTDGSASTENSIMLKGVPKKANIGYLSQLEALRYCQVGSYFKIPYYPIWVIGSSSHFSVLFSADGRINEESDDEALLTKVQRAFKSIDVDECGFIMENRLVDVLHVLEIDSAHDEDWLRRLSQHIQFEGGIILWSKFWETVSMLLSGKSLDEVIEGREVTSRGACDEGEPRERSDSELARMIQDEWNAPGGEDISSTVPIDVCDREELPPRLTRHRTDSIAGKDADTFIVYHYNGFDGTGGANSVVRNKRLTRLTLYRRSQENNVGQSIAFSTVGSAFTGNSSSAIEEVLRTRWPGCRLEWLGSEPCLD